MTDAVAVRGVVATSPRHLVPEAGAPITTFRLVTGEGVVEETGATERRCGERNWYTVTATHQLALSAAACVARGDPLVVSGRLRVRDWQGELQGVTAEIEAQAIGHDLSWGSSVFTRFVAHAHHDADEGVRGDRTGREP
jgi:single-strand DNA-binding protein